MILNFSVSNWRSFRDVGQLSMIATDLEDHSERLAVLKEFGARVLPISIIFGGNASGKSNFIMALDFARRFVLRGYDADQEIGVERFLLNPDCLNMDTVFEFRILVENKAYEFSFSLNRTRITKEKLVMVNEDSDELLYERENDEVIIGDKITKDESIEDRDLLRFLSRSTRKNQLFLSNSIEQNFDLFRPVIEWFRNITIISPTALLNEFHWFFDKQNPVTKQLNKVIQNLDVGIQSIEGDDIPVEHVPISKEDIDRLKRELKEGLTTIMDNTGNKFVLTRTNGGFSAKKLVANHKSADDSNVKFEFRLESEGTRRMIDLLPAFFALLRLNKVLVIDEIDRSMHSMIVLRLLDSYLEECSENTRSQLILTSHNVELMDRRLVRPDEIWVTEKQLDGASRFQSLSEYKDSRSDEDFGKSYLSGKFGGVPHVQYGGLFDLDDDQ